MTQRSRLPRWIVPSMSLAVLAPLVVAVLAQRRAQWHPVYDLAMTELRVRDVGGPHTPLIGLQGRIGPAGSHPGPISFYLLAPLYRLFGSSSFALQVSTVAWHGAAAVTTLLVVARRRDARIVIAVTVLLLLLLLGYGLSPLIEPWNPHLPVLWFMAFLVAVWAVVDGDLPMLLPAVLSASICAQTHVPYLAVTVGVGGGAALLAAIHVWGRRGGESSRDWRWLLAGAGLGLLLWAPPLVDEVVHEPGNLTQLVDHLGTPEADPIGIREAGGFVLERLDAWQLLVEVAHPGTYVKILDGPGPTRERGLVALGAWLVSVGVALRLRHRQLLALHAVVGAAAVVAVVAISRIYGVPWPYLMQWAFGIGALMALSVVGTAAALLVHWWPAMRSTRVGMGAGLGALVLVAGLSARLLVLAPSATTGTPGETAQLGRLVPATVRALEAELGAATGADGRYLVLWSDAATGGAEGIGLVNELVRRGYDVGVDAREGVRMGAGRVRAPQDATARVVLASGGWIDRWAVEPRAVRVGYDDPRSAAERVEFERVRLAAIAALEADGRQDLIEQIDTDLFNVALNSGVDGSVNLLLGRMLDIGVPSAVFVLPPTGGA